MKVEKYKTAAFGILIAIVLVYSQIHEFIFPRTEADSLATNMVARADTMDKRIDAVEKKQNEDMKEIRQDIKGIYQILLNRR